MKRRHHRLRAHRFHGKHPKKGFIMGFPPYNVVHTNGDFTYYHTGLIPSFGVKVIYK